MAAYHIVRSKTRKKQILTGNSISKYVLRDETKDETQVGRVFISYLIVSVADNAEKGKNKTISEDFFNNWLLHFVLW
jgi:hypothetical protein